MIDIEVVVDSIKIKQFKIIPGDVLVYQPWRGGGPTRLLGAETRRSKGGDENISVLLFVGNSIY